MSLDLKGACRACLGTDRSMYSLLESIVPKLDSPPDSVGDQWKFFTKILIAHEDSSLPDKICMECLDEIQRTYSFILKCERSEDFLKKTKNDVKVCLNNLKITSLSTEDSSANIKSENDIYSAISKIKTENFEWNDRSNAAYNDEDPDRQHFEIIIHENADTQGDARSKHTLTVQYERFETLDPMHCENDVIKDEILATQDIKREPELEIYIEKDAFADFESEDKSNTENFKCPICNYECSEMESVEKHVIENHAEGKRCKICNKEFESTAIEHCFTHLHADSSADEDLQSTNAKQHKCTVCSKAFGRKSNLNEHFKIHTGERRFQCEICSKSFQRKHTLVHHLRRHTGERPFKCEICLKTFLRKNQLLNHLRKHPETDEAKNWYEQENYKCNVCSKTFVSSTTLKRHYLIHTGERPFQCQICRKTFRQNCNLTYHVRRHMQKNERRNRFAQRRTDREQANAMIQATVESQVNQGSQDTSKVQQRKRVNLGIELISELHSDNDIRKHEVSVTQDMKHEPDIVMENDEFDEIDSTETFKCPACSYDCRLIESLEVHIIDNHMEGQMCKLCNNEFQCRAIEHCSTHLYLNTTEGILKSNIRQHKCQVCSRIFGLKCSLKRHSTIHTGERPFKCEICPKTFRQKNNLADHLKCHTGERPFQCELCSKTFQRKNQLLNHSRKQLCVKPISV